MRHLTRQMVSIATAGAKNMYGKPTFGADVDYLARVEPTLQLINAETMEAATVKVDVFMPGDVDVSIEDRITLPDGSTPPIAAVEKVPGADGSTYYTRVRCS